MDVHEEVAGDGFPVEAASFLFAAGGLPIQGIIEAHPSIVAGVKTFEPTHTASLFGGLLTVPELQSNCCRLEALAHIAVAFANGKKVPAKNAISAWFSEMSSGPCGRFEDPAEDTFTSLVTTPRGDFRILEGSWESAAFYLQRIVNVVEGMPSDGDWNVLRESVYSLLSLSDLICERGDLPRYTFGNAYPAASLPSNVADALQKYRSRITFTEEDLASRNISPESLAPFLFDPRFRRLIPTASLSHSPLLAHPLLVRNGLLVVAVPTAISVAIRMMVIGALSSAGMRQSLVEAIGSEYREFFSDNSPLHSGRRPPIHFQSSQNGVTAAYAREVDAGRYLQVIFVLDSLKDFNEGGFSGVDPDPIALTDDLDEAIDQCRDFASKKENFREGLTLVIGCGIGRAASYSLPSKKHSDWRTVYLSAADTATLGWLGDVTPLTIWRLLDAEARLASQQVQILNINGLVNLV